MDRGLSDFISFEGEMRLGENSAKVTFRSRISKAGEVEFEFDTLPLSPKTRFIYTGWAGEGSRFAYFSLRAAAADGTTFETDKLHFNSVTLQVGGPAEIKFPRASCSHALFRRKRTSSADNPILLTRVKGFHNLGSLHADTPLGKAAMDGTLEDKGEPDRISGHIAIMGPTGIPDLAAWRTEAEKFLNHLSRVMSLSVATVIRRPITEFHSGDNMEVEAWSQTAQSRSVLPIIDTIALDNFFDCAVKQYFDPPIATRGLFFAIEWLAINATYGEIRLFAGMTALENLINSNLPDEDLAIQDANTFEKTRRALRQIIKTCVKRWDTDSKNSAVSDLNEKLIELNRRSFVSKLRKLRDLWNVPLSDISESDIQNAKRARDLIVHRGHYYDDSNRDDDDLWDHAILIREIVARFLLTALGYRGDYISYVGGFHHSVFPPTVSPVARGD
jgi:hypothetical protein